MGNVVLQYIGHLLVHNVAEFIEQILLEAHIYRYFYTPEPQIYIMTFERYIGGIG